MKSDLSSSKKVPDFADYASRLSNVLLAQDWHKVDELSAALSIARKEEKQVFLCGNGGSAANAIHLANDYLYGIGKTGGKALRVTALPANSAVLTCLGNDVSYADIFSQQLLVLGQPGDILIVFSGSGNSPNVVKALEAAKTRKMKSFAVLGYDGGKCLKLADTAIHFNIPDMQISEDLQMVVGHMIMQRLCKNP